MYNHHALYTHKGQGAASGAGVASRRRDLVPGLAGR